MKRDIFEERVNVKPYEYPHLIEYADSINSAFWLVSEFNFTQDILDFNSVLTPSQKTAVERTMLAISQIEVNVKTFWADLNKRLPKPEVAVVGMTFAESECRHLRAYSHLLEIFILPLCERFGIHMSGTHNKYRSLGGLCLFENEYI